MTPSPSSGGGGAAGATPWSPRSEAEIARERLDGLAAWHRTRHRLEQAAQSGRQSREQRLDLARRMDVLRQQHVAIVARTERHLQESARLVASRPSRRAVVVHRNAWYVDKLAEALGDLRVEVVARLDNGADAVGAAVAEQPDLMLVEDVLPMQSGDDVVREVLAYAPHTLVAAQVAYDDGVSRMLEAGARAVYTRRVPPADVAAALVAVPVG